MISHFFEFMFDIIIAYLSYPALFFIFILGVFIPIIPEELVLLTAGFLASFHIVNVFAVMGIAFLGILAADICGYYIGKKMGKQVLEGLGVRFRYARKIIVRSEKLFSRYLDRAVIFGRFIAGVRFAIPICAGAFSMRFKKFLYYDSVGACIWVITSVTIGYGIGYSLDYALLFNGEEIAGITLGIFIVLYAVWKYYLKKII